MELMFPTLTSYIEGSRARAITTRTEQRELAIRRQRQRSCDCHRQRAAKKDKEGKWMLKEGSSDELSRAADRRWTVEETMNCLFETKTEFLICVAVIWFFFGFFGLHVINLIVFDCLVFSYWDFLSFWLFWISFVALKGYNNVSLLLWNNFFDPLERI